MVHENHFLSYVSSHILSEAIHRKESTKFVYSSTRKKLVGHVDQNSVRWKPTGTVYVPVFHVIEGIYLQLIFLSSE